MRRGKDSQFLLVLLLAAFVFSTSGCRILKIDQTFRGDSHVWITEGGTNTRSNATVLAVNPPLEQVWSYNALAAFGPGPPLVADGIVFVANRQGELHAIDLESGKRRGTASFGKAIEGTPVIADGIVYVSVAWKGKAVQAYDLRRGRVLWRTEHAPVNAGLLLEGDLLFGADVNGTVRAYDRRNGAVVWEKSLGEYVGVHATPIGVGELVVVVDDRGMVTAFRQADGNVEWVADLGSPLYSTPAGTLEAVFVPTRRGELCTLNPLTGELLWEYQVADTMVSITSPAVADHLVVFGGSDGILRALDSRSGKEVWQFVVDGAFASAPMITRDHVYVGTMNRWLYALDRDTGTLQWSHRLNGRTKSAFAPQEGALVVLTEPRHVNLFRTVEEDHVATQ